MDVMAYSMMLMKFAALSCCQRSVTSQITRFMGPTWGPPGSCRPQVGPMLASWTLLSGMFTCLLHSKPYIPGCQWLHSCVMVLTVWWEMSLCTWQCDGNCRFAPDSVMGIVAVHLTVWWELPLCTWQCDGNCRCAPDSVMGIVAVHLTVWWELSLCTWQCDGNCRCAPDSVMGIVAVHLTVWWELSLCTWQCDGNCRCAPDSVMGIVAVHLTVWWELSLCTWHVMGIVAAHLTVWAELSLRIWQCGRNCRCASDSVGGIVAAHLTAWSELSLCTWQCDGNCRCAPDNVVGIVAAHLTVWSELSLRIYKNSQATYFSERCEGGAKNQKFWKTIKPFLTSKQPSCQNIILKEDDKIITDEREICDILMIFSFMWPWISVLKMIYLTILRRLMALPKLLISILITQVL